MNPQLADVIQLLQLERLDLNLFRGESRGAFSLSKAAEALSTRPSRGATLDGLERRVFGGQVLSQALAAAYATLEGREAHSLHAYFLRAGDPDHPIVYEVDRSRDGKSFSSRRVVAIQQGEQIFHMSVSFQVAEEAIDRQGTMPAVPDPDTLPDMVAAVDELQRKAPDRMPPFRAHRQAFEFRPAQLPDPFADVPREPHMKIWFRAVDRVPDDPILHQCLLAYASDYYLLGAASMDARITVNRRDLQMASIDHAMWFHRPARVDEWLLNVLDSPTASGSRGFARGSIYSRDGRLVASTAQEGLVRRRTTG